jgi:hypothetical protein
MKGQAGAVILSVAMLIPNSLLGAARATATAEVRSVDFSSGTISLDGGHGCGATLPAMVHFDHHTRFEYGQDNPVDSSKLVVAKTIELECPVPAGVVRKITIRDISDEDPPCLTKGMELGDFPLDQIITLVSGSQGPDRFSDVEEGPAPKDGVHFMKLKLKLTFSTGNCRINPDPEQVQCDYEYSNTLSKILQILVGQVARQLKLEKQAPGARTQTYTDSVDGVLVDLKDQPPVSFLVVRMQ